MNPCNGNHAASIVCSDPACPKAEEFAKLTAAGQQEANPVLPISQRNFMTLLCIGLARLCGFCQSGLGICQTVLVDAAWRWGWRPAEPEMIRRLQRRVASLEVRRQMKVVARKDRDLKEQREKVEKRFTKNYGPGK